MSSRSLLWASPLPPVRSGIADYAVDVLPHLAALADLRVVSPPDWRPQAADTAWLTSPVIPTDAAPAPNELPVLHMGNNPYHLWIARRLRDFGGVVVLHDTVLHHLLVEEAAHDNDWDRFAGELAGAHGEAGAALATARRWGYTNRIAPYLFPANAVFLKQARGVIVHNRTAERALAEQLPGVPVRRVPLAVGPLPARARAEVRQSLGVREEEILLAHIGFLTPAKGLGVIVRALAVLRNLGVPARLAVVGEGGEESVLAEAVRAGGLGEAVTMLGYADTGRLGDVVAAADLGLVPRYPTAGETSAAVLRFLAAGTPVVVAGYRQFLEFPCEAAFRIPPGSAGLAELVGVVRSFAAEPDRRNAVRAAARRAWEDGGHDPLPAAAALAAALEELA